MKVTICTLGIGSWYPDGVRRLVMEMARVYGHSSDTHTPRSLRGIEDMVWVVEWKSDTWMKVWIDRLPPGAPKNVIEDGYDYTAYCAKPFVLLDALNSGADIAIWIDAAFVPLRRLDPLIEYIAERGYYLCKNGAWVGEWSSDRCLERMFPYHEGSAVSARTEALTIQEISSYCVGLNFSHYKHNCKKLLNLWCEWSADRLCVPGPHANINYNLGASRVNPQRGIRGYVSDDPRVKGHRHDQTVLSILAHRLGFHELTERPKFTSYQGYSTAETVLEHRGM